MVNCVYSLTAFSLCLCLIGLGGFPGGSDSEESACSAGDLGSIPGSGRPPGEGSGYSLQYSCLENSNSADWKLQMVTADMKLKDACSLEEKL